MSKVNYPWLLFIVIEGCAEDLEEADLRYKIIHKEKDQENRRSIKAIA